jgi:indole-3-glycerol phosphate synthase
VSVPCLRKDFIIDPYQVIEARAHTADTFLLLAGVLDAKALEELIQLGRRYGMEPLVESHTADELDTALRTSARIMGINNRDLKSFRVDLGHAKRLLALAERPDAAGKPRIAVCESGIKNRADVEMMTGVGYKVFLIGEALATHPQPAETLRDFIADRHAQPS